MQRVTMEEFQKQTSILNRDVARQQRVPQLSVTQLESRMREYVHEKRVRQALDQALAPLISKGATRVVALRNLQLKKNPVFFVAKQLGII